MLRIVSYCPIEISFTLAMVAILLLLSVAFGVPIMLPSGNSAAFVGLQYLSLLLGVAVWGVFALVGQRRQLGWAFLIALPCYAIVLLVHFNIKLWVPLIRPESFDNFYWQIDRLLRPVVDGSMIIRKGMDPLIAVDSNFYLVGFIFLFYVSFCYHALWTPLQFRKLVIAALFFQGADALAYIAFPAVGPFLYERGLNEGITFVQQGMLAFHRDIIAKGPSWLAIHGPAHLTAGLGAMPSLHTGGAFLFFVYAWRHGRVLVPLYALVLVFILIAAVATRWHYLIDIPVGLGLGWLAVWLADRLVPPPKTTGTAAALALVSPVEAQDGGAPSLD